MITLFHLRSATLPPAAPLPTSSSPPFPAPVKGKTTAPRIEEELPERETSPQKRPDSIKKVPEETSRAFEESTAAERAQLKSRREREDMEEDADIAKLRQTMEKGLANMEEEERKRTERGN